MAAWLRSGLRLKGVQACFNAFSCWVFKKKHSNTVYVNASVHCSFADRVKYWRLRCCPQWGLALEHSRKPKNIKNTNLELLRESQLHNRTCVIHAQHITLHIYPCSDMHAHRSTPLMPRKALVILATHNSSGDPANRILLLIQSTALPYIKCITETGPRLPHVWFGSVNWALAELRNTNDQPLYLRGSPATAIFPPCFLLMRSYVCGAQPFYEAATWQNVPAHHRLQTRQIYYNSICSSWALLSVLCYSLAPAFRNNNNNMVAWHCSNRFL